MRHSGTTMTDPKTPVVTEAQLEAAADTFDLLSTPMRLHLVWLLAAQEHDVTALAEATGATIAATSQQLAKLRAAGVVRSRRDGRRQLYRVDDGHIVEVVTQIFSHITPDGGVAGHHHLDRRRHLGTAR